MEKLQAAIEKAKAKRRALEGAGPQDIIPDADHPDQDAAAAPTTRPASVGTTPRATATREDLRATWAALKPFTPAPRVMRRHRILPPEGNSETAPYDMLRTRVMHRMRKEGWRRLLITSPDASCGKTTIAANLSTSLSRNPELRTMLIDIDLRRPMIGKAFGLRSETSFHEVLEGRALFEDHAARIGTNLAVTSNPSAARSPAELLQSDHAIEVLNDLERRYLPDVMIFDMPPLLGSDDTHAFLPQVDCVLLVAAAEKTTIEQIDAAEKDLADHLPVLGVVLNKCRYTDKEYGYGTYN